jgi:hypothetical protein
MSDYKKKYFKYKIKYLNLLKNISPVIGGLQKRENKEKLALILDKYHIDYTPFTYCDKRGFKQHQGECWNDSIQTLFCFSDALKNQVQKRLFNLTAEDIVEFAFLRERDKYLPYIYKYNEANLKRLKDKLIIYIRLLQQRLCTYLGYNESLKKAPKLCIYDTETCPLSDPNKMLGSLTPPRSVSPINLKTTKSINVHPIVGSKLVRRNSTVIGIEGALTGLEISKNIDIIRKSNIKNEKDHPGTKTEDIILINLLSFAFVDDPYVLIIDIVNIDHKDDLLLSNETIFILIESYYKISGHATGFLKCNNKLFYYDDNQGMLEFNWINYLKYYNDNKKIYKPIINLSKLTKPFFMKIEDNKYYILQDNGKLTESNIEEDTIFTISNFIIVNKIKVNSEIDYINKNAINLLYIELHNKTYQNIKKYIESGLDINTKYTQLQLNILQYILSKDCNNIETIKYLIEEIKIPINYTDLDGNNVFMYIKTQDKQIIEYLINKGCDITKVNNKGSHVLWNLLLSIEDNLDITKYICTVLESKGQNIKKIIDTPNINKNYLLNDLTDKDSINIFKYLVETYKVNMNVPNSVTKYSPIFNAIYEKSNKIFDYIRNHPINVNNPSLLRLQASDGNTLLHIAVFRNNIYAIDKLYEMNKRLNLNIPILKNHFKEYPHQMRNIDINNDLARYRATEKFSNYLTSIEKKTDR